MAGVVFKPAIERDKMFAEFKNLNLADIISRKSTYRYINFVDDESKTLIEVFDYNNIILYYEKQTGVNIGECKECSKLFHQNKVNNAEYCYEHRGYRKIEKKKLICVDCKEEFMVDARNTTKNRCNTCYAKHRKEYDVKRKRNKSKN